MANKFGWWNSKPEAKSADPVMAQDAVTDVEAVPIASHHESVPDLLPQVEKDPHIVSLAADDEPWGVPHDQWVQQKNAEKKADIPTVEISVPAPTIVPPVVSWDEWDEEPIKPPSTSLPNIAAPAAALEEEEMAWPAMEQEETVVSVAPEPVEAEAPASPFVTPPAPEEPAVIDLSFTSSSVDADVEERPKSQLEPIFLGGPQTTQASPTGQQPRASLMVGFESDAMTISTTIRGTSTDDLGEDSIERLARGTPYLAEMLVANKLITLQQHDQALEEQRRNPGPIGQIMVRLGFISENLLVRALAAQMGVGAWHLEKDPPSPDAVHLLPREICEKYEMLPVAVRADAIVVALRRPMDLEAVDVARNISKMRVEPVYASEERLSKAIKAAFSGKNAFHMDALAQQAIDEFGPRSVGRETSELGEIDTRPVVGMVNTIISDAIRMGASDIHIEPRFDRIDLRYRVDGQMQLIRNMPHEVIPMIAARIKIMAELDIVEQRLPQDGHIKAAIDGREVDLRVSVLPNFHGPRIVLRILDKSATLKKLPELGFNETNLQLFRGLVDKPYGLFLVTGPTGSGKTTTLYAALAELNDGHNTILTCEDPVEYDIDGIGQSQVNDKVGLTFAKQLRAILRQDPDIVLVGEIRDSETAETALRASITGHMVLSTLHCNDAPGAIPRLTDMGIDPFLLSTSLVGAMSQRLARKLCPSCAKKVPVTDQFRQLWAAYIGPDCPDFEYAHKGCKECNNLGYKGRRAIHEILPVTKEVAQVIAKHGTLEEIASTARTFGYVTMQELALTLVAQGVTSLQEARRVISYDDSRPPLAESLRLAS
ncbi:MAG: Flp pilus assembly complex ATPase component TadA [Armatimonadetes bacterium]|nr:Flp pilus assembly complex ATPase component TadA [Armatimonadota bacterium]